MSESAEITERLRTFSQSPYDPELPTRSLLVDILVALDRKLGNKPHRTPHLSGGSNLDKTEWEYAGAPAFFNGVQSFLKLEDLNGRDVLDAGCGWGGKSVFFAEHSGLRSLTGFDLPGVFIPDDAASFAEQKLVRNCEFKVGYAERMPVDDRSFDLVIMEDVLEHVRDPVLVLQECLRVLRPRGRAFIKFPSFRMILAHHLDRAVRLPAAHYLLSMRTWAQGLNYRRLLEQGDALYEPFDRVVRTQFSDCVTENLNGMDFAGFSRIVKQTEFKVNELRLMPFQLISARRRRYRRVYQVARRIPLFTEFLSSFILFIGEKCA